jgi:hypothetical protein
MRKISLRTAKQLLAKMTPLSILGLLLIANAHARSFDSFRFVGSDPTPAGTVTAITLNDPASGGAAGELSFFNAAGLSSVFTLAVSPSTVLSGQTRIFDPDNTQRLLSDLHDIAFYTGRLDHSTDNVPPHWFRLTHYQGQWSGTFRVADQVYTLPHANSTSSDGVVEVRTTHSTTDTPIPGQRTRITAAFNESVGVDAQITALESVHVLDGLLTDAIGLTLTLEQLALTDTDYESIDAALIAAADWHQSNTDTMGLDDNLASVFFVDNTDANGTSNTSAINRQAATIVQSLTTDPLFALGNTVGEYLGVPAQANTLQDWQPTALVALPAVHWNQLQREAFAANPPSANLLQTLNNDAPVDTQAPLPQPPPLDPVLVDSDSEERAPPVLQNDASIAPETSGGGSGMWMLLVALILFRHAARQHERR